MATAKSCKSGDDCEANECCVVTGFTGFFRSGECKALGGEGEFLFFAGYFGNKKMLSYYQEIFFIAPNVDALLS